MKSKIEKKGRETGVCGAEEKPRITGKNIGEKLRVVGTSHIAEESIKSIKEAISSWKPDAIALELDTKRFNALMSSEGYSKEHKRLSRPSIRSIGLRGYFFTIIGSAIQKKLGERVGITPGSEMRTAAELALNNRIPITLIDQDIEKTLRNFSRALTFREKFNILFDILSGILFRKETIKFDLSRVPDENTIDMMIERIKKRYPNIHKTLIQDRNRFMAKNIINLMQRNPEKKILAIVGAGHQQEILRLVKQFVDNKLEIVKNNLDIPPISSDTYSYTFRHSLN